MKNSRLQNLQPKFKTY